MQAILFVGEQWHFLHWVNPTPQREVLIPAGPLFCISERWPWWGTILLLIGELVNTFCILYLQNKMSCKDALDYSLLRSLQGHLTSKITTGSGCKLLVTFLLNFKCNPHMCLKETICFSLKRTSLDKLLKLWLSMQISLKKQYRYCILVYAPKLNRSGDAELDPVILIPNFSGLLLFVYWMSWLKMS